MNVPSAGNTAVANTTRHAVLRAEQAWKRLLRCFKPSASEEAGWRVPRLRERYLPVAIAAIAQLIQTQSIIWRKTMKTMKKTAFSLLLALPLLLAHGALAQHQTFTVTPDASAVSFSLGGSDHATHGTFHVQSGSIDFDRSASAISGSVVVAAGSGTTGNQSRDRKMTTVVLDAPHFAEVSFAPHSYQGAIAASGDSTIQVTGTFTLHGTPHEMTVPMQLHIDGGACTAKTKFTVPYVEWGLKDPSWLMFKVAKEVDVDLILVGRLSPST